MQNLQRIGNFSHGFQSRPLDPKDFCMEATGTPRQSVGFPGAKRPVTSDCKAIASSTCFRTVVHAIQFSPDVSLLIQFKQAKTVLS